MFIYIYILLKEAVINNKYPNSPRYQALAGQLGELTVGDISVLTAEQIVNFAPTMEQKILLAGVIESHLRGCIKPSAGTTNYGSTNYGIGLTGGHVDSTFSLPSSTPGYSIPGHGATMNSIISGFKPISNILNFTGCIGGIHSNAEVTIDSLKLRLSMTLGETPANIATLDLSNNYLVNEDIDSVKALAKYTKCKVLKVRSNYFQQIGFNPDDPNDLFVSLKEILGFSSIRYFDITLNPCASIDAVDFYRELKEEHFRKLIFVQRSHVLEFNWRVMVSKPYHDIVLKTHTDYYSRGENPMFST